MCRAKKVPTVGREGRYLAAVDDDFTLLAKWRDGDVDAGDELFERHFDSIHRFFVNKCGDEAPDLVQRTFLAAVRAFDRFKGQSSVRTFLFAIAHHELMAYFRSRKTDWDGSLSSVVDLAPRASSVLVKIAEERALLHALRTLPAEMQIALELSYWEGLPGPVVAEIVGVPEGTVRSRVRRGLELLRERIREIEGGGTPLTTLTTLDGWAREIANAMLQPSS
jgi:RNA polymerase sigma-70 factor (ECF subfamily)